MSETQSSEGDETRSEYDRNNNTDVNEDIEDGFEMVLSNISEPYEDSRFSDFEKGDTPRSIPKVVVNDKTETSSKLRQLWRDHRVPIIIIFISILVIAVVLGILLSGVGKSHNPQVDMAVGTSLAPQEMPILDLPTFTWEAIEMDPNGPQARAYNWSLMDTDNGDAGGPLTSTRLLQRFCLATLYYATNGDQWTNNTNWLSMSEHECNWFSSAHLPDYDDNVYPCDENGILSHLILSNNNLSTAIATVPDDSVRTKGGGLPPETFLLTNLVQLDFQMNAIAGPLSPQVASLTTLKQLRLGANVMSGTIPSEIGTLMNLEILSLFTNKLAGGLPGTLSKASQLTQIWLSSNRLNGTLSSELGLLPNLQILYLDQNQLSGSIPSEIGALSSLRDVILNENQFTSAIPSELGLLSNLVNLDLRSNTLNGTLFTEIGLLANLKSLVLHDNRLNNQLPTDIGNMRNLENLYISSNQLTSSIPTELGNCQSLKILWLNSNPQLTKTIPSELGRLTLVEEIFLSRNALLGTIPSTLGNLSRLRILALQQNPGLTGNVPSEFAQITTLEKITLSRTGMSGVIPPIICMNSEDVLVYDCSPAFCGCSDCACLNG